MIFTLKWLKEYLTFENSVEELCQRLTSLGLEVERTNNPKKDLKGLKIVKIESVRRHPNADKLMICNVFDGKDNLEIVCGANNARKDLYTVLAPVGSILKKNTKNEFKIKKSKIRGIESNGMLCSAEELSLKESSEGIIEIQDTLPVGENYSDFVNEEYVSIEIAITPNRVDCASIYGIARDLSASGFGTLKKLDTIKCKHSFESPITIINNLNETDCPQFCLRLIRDVKNIRSQENLSTRLKNCGIKIISSLVDITNYINHEHCRPLHVFDFDKIHGNQIIIRHSKKGEKFLGLDDIEYSLEDGMIVICDEKKIISLAGVLGGKNTACDSNTKNVLVESAFFASDKIALAGRKLNIVSDARYRFERGIDPNSTLYGIELATKKILEVCGGNSGSIIFNGVNNYKTDTIQIQKNFFQQVLGYQIDLKFISESLSRLGCAVSLKDDIFFVTPPSWRSDLKIKEDFVEEIARIFGYEKIPSKKLVFSTPNEKNQRLNKFSVSNKIRKLLVSRNMAEVITWSFCSEQNENLLTKGNFNIKIKNPISSDLGCLRSNLIPNLLSIIKNNNNKNIKDVSMFEIGPIFFGYEPGQQIETICGIRSGKAYNKNWLEKNRDFDIFDVKADLFSILKMLGINEGSFKQIRDSKVFYHPGKSGAICVKEKILAYFAEIHPNILKEFEINSSVAAFEININFLMDILKEKKISKSKFLDSSFQSSIRDFSFEIEKNILSSDIVSLIKKIDKQLIKEVFIFDNYVGKDSNDTIRSISVEVKIQSDTETLSETLIQNLSNNIVKSVVEKFEAKQR